MSDKRKLKKKAWELISKYMRLKNPICQLCKRQNSEIVHHIVKRSKGLSVYFLEDNLMALCTSCHYKIHYVYDWYDNKTWIENTIGENEYLRLKVISKGNRKYSTYDFEDMIKEYKLKIKDIK